MAALNLGVGFKSPLRHTRNLWSDLRIGPFCRPRTGRETSRNNANQRELLSISNGSSEAVSGRLRRSAVWSASIWGTEGRRFKSRQSDNKNRRLGVVVGPIGWGGRQWFSEPAFGGPAERSRLLGEPGFWVETTT